MVQELLPLLQLSDSPRIVNFSSVGGKLEFVRNEWAMRVLSGCLTEDKVDEVLTASLKDFKEESSHGVHSDNKGLHEGKWFTRADGESGVSESAVVGGEVDGNI
ncbi:hypothetical protein RND71_001218 [Anisodus tanguticus]|uniref:Uncharacterized protein n=1 Tax=Anisodus tanguticus TaxID=243964 RepID=A0AAE1T2G3_9SOLA|nr:hypothetical protein RND71_001218 [Anisodus tanguticus]